MKYFSIILILFISIQAFCCECLERNIEGKSNFDIQFEKSDFVAIGRMIEKNEQVYPIEYQLETRLVFKGKKDKIITIISGIGGSDCGFQFNMSDEYVIYGNNYEKEQIRVDICSRTLEIHKSADYEILTNLNQSYKDYWSETLANYIQYKTKSKIDLMAPIELIYYNGNLLSKIELMKLNPKDIIIEIRNFSSGQLKAVSPKIREKATNGVLVAYKSFEKQYNQNKLIRKLNKTVK